MAALAPAACSRTASTGAPIQTRRQRSMQTAGRWAARILHPHRRMLPALHQTSFRARLCCRTDVTLACYDMRCRALACAGMLFLAALQRRQERSAPLHKSAEGGVRSWPFQLAWVSSTASVDEVSMATCSAFWVHLRLQLIGLHRGLKYWPVHLQAVAHADAD